MIRLKRFFLLAISLMFAELLFGQSSSHRYDLLVACDGSGSYKTIQEAINAVPDNQVQRTTLFIKNGTYKEKIKIAASKKNISLTGEDELKTILTFDDYSSRIRGKDTINTSTSCSISIEAEGFIAEHITFENSAGRVGQAVAVKTLSDKIIFRSCRFLGNQDTFYANGTGRVYLADCYIEGTTDFIFGSAIVWFENCLIHSKFNSYITAASTPKGNQFGYVFHRCRLTADSATTKVFLGRPWRPYAKCVYLNCWLGAHIRPEGWDNWRNPENEKTAFYAEYQSVGPGAPSAARVGWSHQLSKEEAGKYSLEHFFGIDAAATPYSEAWNPQQ